MLTYSFEESEGPIYLHLYKCIKDDILSGVLKPGEKLPSKRTFARHNGMSTITIQNAYDQLISEGYVYSLEKKGYYVSNIEGMKQKTVTHRVSHVINMPKQNNTYYDFSSNRIPVENFPFSIWAKVSRNVISHYKDELMLISPSSGLYVLRLAIAKHLQSFRGMIVDPDQIIIGAGTEYLYGQIVELLGKDKVVALENPGYRKLETIYQRKDVTCHYIDIDEQGIRVDQLDNEDILHICPNHHYPTGITMPASRRYEVLAWANKKENRYIIEDDYDSEFRETGKPIPTLFSIDALEKVIYMNTFSKSLTPTIRISYMVLPVTLVNLYYKKMSMYSCTVSNFEQYTLAKFISEGYFEKHINRMRLFYRKKRARIIDIIEKKDYLDIIENDAGLHFIIKIHTHLTDEEVKCYLEKKNMTIQAISNYYFNKTNHFHDFIINYSNLDENQLVLLLECLDEIAGK